jgi:Cd(II)/Pb(II)-responsive transcriptional regulator
MKIGELAQRTHCQVATIRYYEKQGLLPYADRTEANYRIYSDKHCERLRFILYCRSLDMALNEIRALLKFKDSPEEDCAEVSNLLDAHIGHVAQRIQELHQLEEQLKSLRASCKSATLSADCGILNQLSTAPSQPKNNEQASVHVLGSHTVLSSNTTRARQ